MSSTPSSFRFSGTKRALLVGVNYIGQQNELQGPVNDVKLIYNHLITHCSFDPKNVAVCCDKKTKLPNVTEIPPTKEFILGSLRLLIDASEPGDSVWLSYSGHGDKKWDTSCDEKDGFDQTILPSDHAAVGHIVDDELFDIVKDMPEGGRFTAMFDCCNCGTVLDLPYRYKVDSDTITMKFDGDVQAPSKTKIVRALMAGTVTGAVHGAEKGSRSKGLFGGIMGGISGALSGASADPSNGYAAARYLITGKGQVKEERSSDPIRSEILCFSGTKDYLPAQDNFNDELQMVCGQMTYAFLRTLRNDTVKTYRDVLNVLGKELHYIRFMSPQFSTSHPFDLDNEVCI